MFYEFDAGTVHLGIFLRKRKKFALILEEEWNER